MELIDKIRELVRSSDLGALTDFEISKSTNASIDEIHNAVINAPDAHLFPGYNFEYLFITVDGMGADQESG